MPWCKPIERDLDEHGSELRIHQDCSLALCRNHEPLLLLHVFGTPRQVERVDAWSNAESRDAAGQTSRTIDPDARPGASLGQEATGMRHATNGIVPAMIGGSYKDTKLIDGGDETSRKC